MERKEGYYWVKSDENTDWQIAEWSGTFFYPTATEIGYMPAEFIEIDETPIIRN